MQSRSAGWIGWLLILLAGVPAILVHGGCAAALLTPIYLLKGNNAPAAFDGLKGRTVAIVCRPVVELEYSSAGAASDLTVHVARLLEENVRKVKVVDPRTVAEWMDENGSSDPLVIGREVGADLVLSIDLEGFSLYQGQTLYQGHSIARATVLDVATGKAVFEKPSMAVVFPPNHAIPAQDKTEEAFRRQFVAVVADRIARNYYPHDTHADFAVDSEALD